MDYVVTTPPTVELLTSSEVTAHVLPVDTSDATYIAAAIKDAREYCEGITGRALAAQTITAYPERFEYVMRLPREPIKTITSVKYTDSDGVEVTMAATNYILNEANGTLTFIELPDYEPRVSKPIAIVYTAGETVLPGAVRRAMLLLIAYWYDNRGDKELPSNVEAHVNRLLNGKKVWFV